MSTAKKLRPYQKAAVKAALDAISDGQSGLIHIATGGGKTVVGAEIIRKHSSGHVLWLTKDWTLLEQASESVALQAPDLLQGRIGGLASALSSLEEHPADAGVIFTTLHTFVRRLDANTYPDDDGPSLIVWDECHWGEGSPMGRRLVAFAKTHGAPILGLTATPRGFSLLPTLHRTTLCDLIAQEYLARPVIVPAVETGVDWTPERSSDEGDFTGTSLRALAENDERNATIVDHWRAHARQYGATIIFACNIAHAECLGRLFKDAGASVGIVHCDLEGRENRAEIEQYKAGELDVIINVAMLTHGFDAPKTRTIFLTRPTASPVLYAQMIGRGSRIAAGKKEFHIVEFTDNVQAHHGSVLHPESILWDGP
jgi:ATP-dependent helicase IRC3